MSIQKDAVYVYTDNTCFDITTTICVCVIPSRTNHAILTQLVPLFQHLAPNVTVQTSAVNDLVYHLKMEFNSNDSSFELQKICNTIYKSLFECGFSVRTLLEMTNHDFHQSTIVSRGNSQELRQFLDKVAQLCEFIHSQTA